MRAFLVRIMSIFPVLLALASIFSSQCKLPWDYEPDRDSLTEPPDPPRILEPRPDTTLWWAAPGLPTVNFGWTVVAGCDYHEIDIDTSGNFLTPSGDPYRIVVRASSPPQVVQSFVRELQRKYYCRMRAVKSVWRNGATDWSQSRSFVLRNQPGW